MIFWVEKDTMCVWIKKSFKNSLLEKLVTKSKTRESLDIKNPIQVSVDRSQLGKFGDPPPVMNRLKK